MRKVRRVAVIFGLGKFLEQCIVGLALLSDKERSKECECEGIFKVDPDNLDGLMQLLAELGGRVDVLIVGDNGLNILPHLCDKILRRHAKNYRTAVIGVAFADYSDPTHQRTQAAALSLASGKNQVVSNSYIASDGFTQAVVHATSMELPEIKKEKNRLTVNQNIAVTLNEALTVALNLAEARLKW